MEIFLEFLIEAVGELFLQIIFEGLFESGFSFIAEIFQRKNRKNPFLAFIGYSVWGVIFGGISIILFPNSLIKNKSIKIINLIATPIISGLAMTSIGRWRKKRGKEIIRLDKFAYGFIFAFGMAIVRYFYTK